MTWSNDEALIIFIKNPQLGKVKTRIAKDSSDKEALDIYHQLMDHTRVLCQEIPCKKYLYYSDEITDDLWSSELFEKKVQRGMDLGERMLDAFINVLSYHQKAIIIGSDCIYLQKDHIRNAFEALDNHDHVLGPAKDGGYYLHGMKSVFTDVFINIPWSSGNELAATKTALEKKSRSYHLGETLNDIDHYSDWQEYLNSK